MPFNREILVTVTETYPLLVAAATIATLLQGRQIRPEIWLRTNCIVAAILSMFLRQLSEHSGFVVAAVICVASCIVSFMPGAERLSVGVNGALAGILSGTAAFAITTSDARIVVLGFGLAVFVLWAKLVVGDKYISPAQYSMVGVLSFGALVVAVTNREVMVTIAILLLILLHQLLRLKGSR